MKIDKLSLRNFKGVEELTIDPKGGNVNIFGPNASGKTTIFDAYLWLLFDKDSSDRTTFEIKTIDKEGGVIHNLEHEVTATLDVNGKKVIIKKMLKEKWTKKKGTQTSEFTGHETSYWIDELPVKKVDFDKAIQGFIEESLFKLLGNPEYFNVQLKWQDRRKMLFDAFIKEDIDLFALKPELLDIKEEILKHGADNLKKITSEKRRLCNNELEQIPTRIDETTRNLPSLNGMNEAIAEKEELLKKKAIIDSQISKVEESKKNTDSALTTYRNKSFELEKLKDKIVAAGQKTFMEAKENGTKLYYEIQDMKKQIKDFMEKKENRVKRIETLESLKSELLRKWKDINAETFQEPDVNDFKCPTCKQPLPENDITAKIEELKVNFTNNKKNRLDTVSKQGHDTANEIKERLAEKLEFEELIVKTEEAIKTKTEEMNGLVKIYDENKDKPVDYASNLDYVKASAELEKLMTASFDDFELVNLRTDRDILLEKIAEVDKKVALKDVAEQAGKRLEELHFRQRDLSQEIADLEKKEFKIEEYIKLKAKTVESSINTHFKIVKWKLFETQINGGINEVCVATVNNVPYPDLNAAGKIQAGLDIIKAFAEVHKLEAPIFIDNSESIIEIPDTGAQQVRLYVFDTDKDDNKEIIEIMLELGKWKKNGKLYVEVK